MRLKRPWIALLAGALAGACKGEAVGPPLGEAGTSGSRSGEHEDRGQAGQRAGRAGSGSEPESSRGGHGGSSSLVDAGSSGVDRGGAGPGGSGAGGTGGVPPTGGASPIGGAPAAGGTGGALSTGGAPLTGGAPPTGGTGGAFLTGGIGGSSGTGGAAGGSCSEGQTRYDCSDGRQVCSAGVWQGDRTCYAQACDLVDCGSVAQECCEGWGPVGVEGYTWEASDEIVTSFGFVTTPDRYVEATFSFTNPQDIGAITMFLSEPVPWGSITQVEVVMTYGGNPLPVVELSLENSVDTLGGIWYLEQWAPGLFVTPVDMYGASLFCFLAGCPEDSVDLINVRLRPLDMAGSSSTAELQVSSLAITGF